MKQVYHKNFHVLEHVPADKDKSIRMFVLDTWKPPQDIWLIGCAIGLLCLKTENFEIYLVVSKNPSLRPKKYLVGLKKDWLFYQQRDVYTYSSGINDLISYYFLPENCGFLIKKGEPLYIKVAAMNLTEKPMAYDALCNLYYLLV